MVHTVWVRELRAPFLLLQVLFVPAGVAVAWVHGYFNLLTALLTLVGVLCLHAGVNILNDYFDYKSGIDLITTPTPFSGGSRILPDKALTPNKVLAEGLLFLTGGIAAGIFFIINFAFDSVLIIFLAIGAVSVVGYSPVFSRLGLGELLAGVNFGPLVVLGTYYVQTRSLAFEPLFIGLCLGILTSCILYINEFPDTDADSQKGRLHLVARWGKEASAKRFKFLIGSAYTILIVGVTLRIVTPFALISLLTLPKAISACRLLSRNYAKTQELIPAMGNTVLATLWTAALILLGYVLAGILMLILV